MANAGAENESNMEVLQTSTGLLRLVPRGRLYVKDGHNQPDIIQLVRSYCEAFIAAFSWLPSWSFDHDGRVAKLTEKPRNTFRPCGSDVPVTMLAHIMLESH